VALGLTVNYNLLLEEITIDRGIKYIPDNVVMVTSVGVGMSIP
jgi:hypothetical protein